MSDAPNPSDALARRIAGRRTAPGVLALQPVQRRHARLGAPSRFQALSGRLLARAAAAAAPEDEAFVWYRAAGAPESSASDLQPAQPAALGTWVPRPREAGASPRPPVSRKADASAWVASPQQASNPMPAEIEPPVQQLFAKRTSSPGLVATHTAAALRADPDRTTISRVAAASALTARYAESPSSSEVALRTAAPGVPWRTDGRPATPDAPPTPSSALRPSLPRPDLEMAQTLNGNDALPSAQEIARHTLATPATAAEEPALQRKALPELPIASPASAPAPARQVSRMAHPIGAADTGAVILPAMTPLPGAPVSSSASGAAPATLVWRKDDPAGAAAQERPPAGARRMPDADADTSVLIAPGMAPLPDSPVSSSASGAAPATLVWRMDDPAGAAARERPPAGARRMPDADADTSALIAPAMAPLPGSTVSSAASGAAPTAFVWRKSATTGPRLGFPAPRAASAHGGPTIARESADGAGADSMGTSAAEAPAHAAAAGATARGASLAAVAERVGQMFQRRMEIEQERRGIRRWRQPS